MNYTILTEAQIAALLFDSEPWLSCDDCFVRVDGYVERAAAGLCSGDPEMDVHLAACPACRDEADILLALLTGFSPAEISPGSDPR